MSTGGERNSSNQAPRSPGVLVFVAAAMVLGTLAKAGPGWRDAGELGAAAQSLGVPHPTGFPLDMLLLRAGTLLPLGSVAFRQNVTVALIASAALGLIAHVAFTLAQRVGLEARVAAPAAMAGVVALASWETWLASAVQVEVYATSLALIAALATVALASRPRPGAAACLAGLGLGAHVTAPLGSAPLLVASWLRVPRRRRHRALALALAMGAVTALVVAYVPLASLGEPPVDWGDPETWPRLWAHLTAGRIREAYGDEMLGATTGASAAAALGGQLGELGPWLGLAAVGLFVAARSSLREIRVLGAILAIDVVYAVLVNPMGIADRQVGHNTGACLVVLGIVGAARLLAEAGRVPWGRSLGLALSALLAAGSVVGAPRAVLADPHAAGELWGSGGPLYRLPPRAVLLCSTDDVCASALFARHAERVRPDVTVVPAQHLWEPTLRQKLTGAFPDLTRLEGRRPTHGRARSALAIRTGRLLLGDGPSPRPVFWTSDKPFGRRGILQQPLVPSTVPPWLAAAAHGPVANPAANPVASLDRLREARFKGGRPTQPRARTAWSQAYGRVGRGALAAADLGLALRAFEHAARVAPERAVAWTNLGVTLAEAGHLEAAIEASRQAIRRDARRPTPWVNLVRFAVANGDLAAARRTLRLAERANVTDPRLDRLRTKIGAGIARDAGP